MRGATCGLSAAVALAFAPVWSSAQTPVIGNVAAANEEVVGTPPASDPRQLRLGLEVVANERVETSSVGAGQFLFLDQTALTVWPNSDVTLDSYVYDPDRQAGEMSLSVGRGVLRFIGGRISKGSDVRIETPHTVVAVRGGIAQIEVTEERTTALHVAGEYTQIGSVRLARPNALGVAEAGGPARFEGVADRETVRESWGRTPGEGDGGAPAPVTPEATQTLIEAAGIAALGSDDPEAPTARPVSTSGEAEQPPSEAPVEEFTAEVRDETGQALVEQETEQAVEEENMSPPEEFVLPEDAIELTGFVGGRTFTEDGSAVDYFGTDILDAASSDIAVGRPEDQIAFEIFFREPDPDTDTGFDINARSARGAFVQGDENVGFTFEAGLPGDPEGGPDFNDIPTDLSKFVAPETFYVFAFSSIEFTPAFLVLDVFGDPTPTDFWAAESADDIEVRAYDLSGNYFAPVFSPAGDFERLSSDPLPQSVLREVGGALFDIDPPLLLVPEPNAPLTDEPGGGNRSKWLLPYVAIQGQGAQQRSAHGVLTRRVLSTPKRHPALDGSMYLTTQIDAAAPPAGGFINAGTPVTVDGATTYGAGGEYFVLSDVSVQGAENDQTVSRASDYWAWDYRISQERYETFGMTRVAELSGSATLDAANRIGKAVALEDSWIGDPEINPVGASVDGDRIPDDRYTHVFDGGYASIAAYSRLTQPTTRVATPYLLRTNTPDDVRFGFSPENNSSVGEFGDGFDDLAAQGDRDGFVLAAGTQAIEADGTPIEVAPALQLAWGNSVSGDVMLTDSRFYARHAFELEGYLTGQEPRLFNQLGRPSRLEPEFGETQQDSWRGSLTTADATPDAFDTAVQTHNGGANGPAYLTWGWWSGEYRFDPDDAQPDFRDRRDRMHLGAWVAGVQSDITALEFDGEATYDGFAVGNVLETPAEGGTPLAYVDDGRARLTYDFGARSGSVLIDGVGGVEATWAVSQAEAFDSERYPGAPDYPRTNHYAGDLASVTADPEATGRVEGAFFRGGDDPIAASAGSFEFDTTRANGARVQAAGVFAAER